MNSISIPIKTLASLLGTYEKRAIRWARKNAHVKEVEGMGRGGRQLMVALESLPEELQKKYFENINIGRRSGMTAREKAQLAVDAYELISKNSKEESELVDILEMISRLCGGYFVQGEESVDFAIGRATEEIKKLQASVRKLRALKK